MIRFQAWGAIDVESMPRLQRRAHLNHIKQEVAELGLEFAAGGQPPERAFYGIKGTINHAGTSALHPDIKPWLATERGQGALQRICRWLVDNKDPANRQAEEEPQNETTAR